MQGSQTQRNVRSSMSDPDMFLNVTPTYGAGPARYSFPEGVHVPEGSAALLSYINMCAHHLYYTHQSLHQLLGMTLPSSCTAWYELHYVFAVVHAPSVAVCAASLARVVLLGTHILCQHQRALWERSDHRQHPTECQLAKHVYDPTLGLGQLDGSGCLVLLLCRGQGSLYTRLPRATTQQRD